MAESVLQAALGTMPDTPGEWVALAGASFLDGLESPYTWASLLLGGLLAVSCGLVDQSGDTRLVGAGWRARLGWRRTATGREEQR